LESKIREKAKGDSSMKFTANVIEPSANSTTANLLFADPDTDPDAPSVLSFSRAIDIPNSAYYFEINDQSYGSYGGLETVTLSRGRVEIRVSDGVIEKFGVEEFREVQADFEADDEMYQAILTMMRKIFEGFEGYQEI
jgi:hypothetical protein